MEKVKFDGTACSSRSSDSRSAALPLPTASLVVLGIGTPCRLEYHSDQRIVCKTVLSKSLAAGAG